MLEELNQQEGIINQLAGMGIKFEDEIQGLWLLGTLPDTWETFRTLVNCTRWCYHMELAKDSILNEEMEESTRVLNSDVSVIEKAGENLTQTAMELVLHNVKHVGYETQYISQVFVEDGYKVLSPKALSSIDNDDMTEFGIRDWSMSEKRDVKLFKKIVLSGVHDINKKCSRCLAGKQIECFKSRPSFRRRTLLDWYFLMFVVPKELKTLGGCSYLVTLSMIIQGRLWVYTLKIRVQIVWMLFKHSCFSCEADREKLKCIRKSGCNRIGWRELDVCFHIAVAASFWGFGSAKMFHTIFTSLWMLYDPVQKKLVRSRDVEFDEDQTLKDVEKTEKETIPQHNDDPID
ncbi:hypothetical protein Tco_0809157 [Tanacetum coccineum]